jgi:hypothetical protein
MPKASRILLPGLLALAALAQDAPVKPAQESVGPQWELRPVLAPGEERMKSSHPDGMPVYGAGSKYLGRAVKQTE